MVLDGERRAGQRAQFAGAGQRAGSVHLAEKLCSFFLLDTQSHTSERAGRRDCGGSAVGAKYIVRGTTTQHKLYKQRCKTSARLLPLESSARRCSGSRFFCALGPAVQGRSSRASSPARPCLDLDHALLHAPFCSAFDRRRGTKYYRKIKAD